MRLGRMNISNVVVERTYLMAKPGHLLLPLCVDVFEFIFGLRFSPASSGLVLSLLFTFLFLKNLQLVSFSLFSYLSFVASFDQMILKVVLLDWAPIGVWDALLLSDFFIWLRLVVSRLNPLLTSDNWSASLNPLMLHWHIKVAFFLVHAWHFFKHAFGRVF